MEPQTNWPARLHRVERARRRRRAPRSSAAAARPLMMAFIFPSLWQRKKVTARAPDALLSAPPAIVKPAAEDRMRRRLIPCLPLRLCSPPPPRWPSPRRRTAPKPWRAPMPPISRPRCWTRAFVAITTEGDDYVVSWDLAKALAESTRSAGACKNLAVRLSRHADAGWRLARPRRCAAKSDDRPDEAGQRRRRRESPSTASASKVSTTPRRRSSSAEAGAWRAEGRR